MSNFSIKKAVIFIFSTLFLSLSSFLLRNFLVTNYNNYDFGLFKIDYIKNSGAAFSLFSTHTSALAVISAAILFGAILYIFTNLDKFKKTDIFFASLLCSGIVCNLVERVSDGYVTDYLRLKFVAFPIFNISDLFICAGAFMIICNILFNSDDKKTV